MDSVYASDRYSYYMFHCNEQPLQANDSGDSSWQIINPQRSTGWSPLPYSQGQSSTPVFRTDAVGYTHRDVAAGERNEPLCVQPMILLPSNKIVLVPKDENINNSLLQMIRDQKLCTGPLSMNSTPKKSLWLNICPAYRMPAMSSMIQSLGDSCIVPILPTPLASVRLPPKLTNPKYITKSESSNSYRVQVNIRSKSFKNKKFSRNVSSLKDAMWLCEYALMMSCSISSLQDLIAKGNYECFLQRRMIDSLSEFSVKLRSNALVFKDCGILRQPEYACVHEFLSCHSFSGLESTVGDHMTGRKRNRGEDEDVRCHESMHDVETFFGQPESVFGSEKEDRGEDESVRCHDSMNDIDIPSTHTVRALSKQPEIVVGGAQSNER